MTLTDASRARHTLVAQVSATPTPTTRSANSPAFTTPVAAGVGPHRQPDTTSTVNAPTWSSQRSTPMGTTQPAASPKPSPTYHSAAQTNTTTTSTPTVTAPCSKTSTAAPASPPRPPEHRPTTAPTASPQPTAAATHTTRSAEPPPSQASTPPPATATPSTTTPTTKCRRSSATAPPSPTTWIPTDAKGSWISSSTGATHTNHYTNDTDSPTWICEKHPHATHNRMHRLHLDPLPHGFQRAGRHRQPSRHHHHPTRQHPRRHLQHHRINRHQLHRLHRHLDR